ncbi:MAG TPA: MotA/TolQ/ExbB proton channel family protein [Rhizomicrobium sp.]|jgi:biopolymer transport protein ExbB|nr:MotA/TolQ/ExbB proton channel family protein [Rhizomicrobium sp.]
MNFKKLTIAAAIVAMTSLSAVAPVYAQAAPAAPAADQNAAPAPAAPAADQAAAPAPAAPSDAAKSAAAPADVPAQYSLGHIWQEGSWISKAILIVLAIMSAGTWYIFFTKWIEQQRILGQATQVEKKFWTSATLNEGVDKLPKTSVFRGIAEAGLKASTGGTTLVGLNDWIGMTLTRQLEDANARLQGGIAFLGSVGSVSPFVGLLGTVMGILNALIGIGVAGQASIDKVAGPVGEALIMTAIGLFVAVPAVLLYNYLVRRNKVITEKLRAFAGDLQAYLISKSK